MSAKYSENFTCANCGHEFVTEYNYIPQYYYAISDHSKRFCYHCQARRNLDAMRSLQPGESCWLSTASDYDDFGISGSGGFYISAITGYSANHNWHGCEQHYSYFHLKDDKGESLWFIGRSVYGSFAGKNSMRVTRLKHMPRYLQSFESLSYYSKKTSKITLPDNDSIYAKVIVS